MLTFEDIKNNEEIRIYIEQADQVLEVLGYTEHSFPHVTGTAQTAGRILKELGFSQREQELAKIAGYMHDIGNIVNREDHAQSGAIMAFRILQNMGMDTREVAQIISAIGNHDEATAAAVNPVAAALILADKSDVRRSRVRNPLLSSFDIHDRVNYAVQKSSLHIRLKKDSDKGINGGGSEQNAGKAPSPLKAGEILLDLTIDTDISPVLGYFEIFLGRMLLCRRAAEFLGLDFGLVINGQKLL